MKPEYYPGVFDVKDFNSARNIILTPEDGATTEQRWKAETPHIVDLIIANTGINRHSRVLDFGCGIGRVSKALIEKLDCTVVGADISASMRAISHSYVNHPNFFSVHPSQLDYNSFFRKSFDVAISVWALQHVESPALELRRIGSCLKNSFEAKFFIVNEGNSDRVVPFKDGWYNDGIVLRDEIDKHFKMKAEGKLDPAFVPQSQSERTFWAVYDRR